MTTRRWLALLWAAVLVLGACGSDDEGSDDDGDSGADSGDVPCAEIVEIWNEAAAGESFDYQKNAEGFELLAESTDDEELAAAAALLADAYASGDDDAEGWAEASATPEFAEASQTVTEWVSTDCFGASPTGAG